MEIAVLGINLGKTVCSLAGLGGCGAVVFRKSIQRFKPFTRSQTSVGGGLISG